MARGPITWDAPRQNVDARPQAGAAPKPKHVSEYECSECGDEIGPHWGEGGFFYCRACASDDLKNPTGASINER